jgi:tetratricopeptide (TPR) repeat protein
MISHVGNTGDVDMFVLSTAKSLAMTAAVLSGAIQDCNDAQNAHKQIAGCSLYIASGQAEGENLVTAYVNRAIAQFGKKQYKKAFADFDAALKVDAGNWLVLYNRGIVYLDLGKAELAAADFGSAIESDPNTGVAYFNRGLAYERLGKLHEAAADFRRAFELDPNDENAKAHLDTLTAVPQG